MAISLLIDAKKKPLMHNERLFLIFKVYRFRQKVCTLQVQAQGILHFHQVPLVVWC